jgi:hypothetical protein
MHENGTDDVSLLYFFNTFKDLKTFTILRLRPIMFKKFMPNKLNL